MTSSTFLEMLGRYASSLRDLGSEGLIGLTAGGILIVLFLRLHAKPESAETRLRTVLFVLIVSLVLGWAWHLRWVGDDAFISFRYAKNLAQGNGLVFNPGERVEGYTNFLWTILIAAAIALKGDPLLTSLALSLLSLVGVLAVSLRIVRHLSPPGQPILFSWAVLLLGAHYTFASYATSGLETLFATFWVTLALERALERKFFISGLSGILATMTHPDHLVFYAALAGALSLTAEDRKGLIRYGLPLLLLYLPYFLLRWHYYGDFFPNTFYAKSADQFYFRQGAVYIAASLIGGGLWSTLPLGLFELWRRRKELFGRYLLIALPLYLFYIAKIGGDFMYGRLFCPVLPPIFLAVELGARHLLANHRGRLAAAALGLTLFAALPTRILRPFEKKWHLADERTFYRLASLSPLRIDSLYFDWAMKLRRHLVEKDLHPMIAVDCAGMIGYWTGLPLIDNYGLTDRTTAHQSLAVRSRPGHEKVASPDYLRRRGVILSDRPVPSVPGAPPSRVMIEGVPLYWIRYDASLAHALSQDPDVDLGVSR